MGSNNTDVPHFPVKIITKLEEFVVECRANMKVQYLKWKIFSLKKIEPKQQRLFFEGIELEEPDYELSLYGIEPIEQNAEFKLMLVQFYQGIPQTYFLDESHYDAKWNCSFEGITINKKESRGGKPYIPPIGCVRYGVKVLGKYENDTWLGGKGYRTEDEWPVAYHGTKELNVLEILRKGFLIEKGVRFAYGKGIYCSPDPRVALGYAHDYAFEDKNYKLIIQCRVDPNKLKIHGNYWLVTDEKHIRPYAICVFSENRIMELNKYLSAFGGVVMQPAARVILNPMPNVQPPPMQNVQIPPIQPIPVVQYRPVQPIPNVQFPPVQPIPNIRLAPMPQLPPMPNIQDIMRANLVGNALSKAVPNNSTQKK